MSNGEVKRWYLYTENEALYAVSKNQRGFVPDASTIEVMRVEDHERVVAQKDAQIDSLRTVLEAVRSQMCWERDRDQLAMGMASLHDDVTKALEGKND